MKWECSHEYPNQRVIWWNVDDVAWFKGKRMIDVELPCDVMSIFTWTFDVYKVFAQTFKERMNIRTLIPCFFKWRMVGACPPVSFTQKHLNRSGMFTIILKTWTMLWSGSRTVVMFQTPQHDMTTFACVHVKQVPQYKKSLSLIGKPLNRFNDSLFTLDTFHRSTDA